MIMRCERQRTYGWNDDDDDDDSCGRMGLHRLFVTFQLRCGWWHAILNGQRNDIHTRMSRFGSD